MIVYYKLHSSWQYLLSRATAYSTYVKCLVAQKYKHETGLNVDWRQFQKAVNLISLLACKTWSKTTLVL